LNSWNPVPVVDLDCVYLVGFRAVGSGFEPMEVVEVCRFEVDVRCILLLLYIILYIHMLIFYIIY
jgi:hypothetical protein